MNREEIDFMYDDGEFGFKSLDPMVKPVVYAIHKKGYFTTASCQGHGPSGKPYMIIQDKKPLLNVFKKHGFKVNYKSSSKKMYLPGHVTHGKPISVISVIRQPLKSEKERETMWKNIYQDIIKLDGY